ncbi:hypothetical protein KAR91_79305 [Candidatus Pacearchaeota archaeon]|nr:hypothetical protein [Candidatus Pacearchaeota archaeon]
MSDLNQSISDMSEDVLRARILELRGERRKNDKPIRAKKASKKKKPLKVKNLKSMAAAMGKDERLALIEMLEESL